MSRQADLDVNVLFSAEADQVGDLELSLLASLLPSILTEIAQAETDKE